MPKLDTKHVVTISSPTTTNVTVSNPGIPGLELRLPAQSVIRDMDGQNVTQLSITPIPINQALPNNVTLDYTYDKKSQVTAIAYKKNGSFLGDLTYTYDASGRRTKLGGSFARLGFPAAISSHTYNAANQMTQRGSSTLTYDNNGNLSGDGTNTYSWDARNQLTSMSGPGLSASFLYDGIGRRIKKTVNGSITEYLYDGATAVQEISGGTPVANLLTGGLDATFTRTDANGTRTFLTDGRPELWTPITTKPGKSFHGTKPSP